MDRRLDALGAILFALLGGAVLVVAATAPPSRIVRDSVGTWGLPALVGLLLLVGGTIQTYRSVWLARRQPWIVPTEGETDEPGHPASPVRPIAFGGGMFAYLLLLQPLGYLVATPLFVVAGMRAMDIRHPVFLIAAGLGFTVVTFLVFSSYLAVPLPTGILTDLLVDLGLIQRVR